MSRVTKTDTEPGIVILGEWAHVRWGGHHLVVADDPDDQLQPIRTACGRRFERFRIWHHAPRPWLPQCRICARAEAREAADRHAAIADEHARHNLQGPACS